MYSTYSFIAGMADRCTFYKNYLDKIIDEEGQEWLKNRYDDLTLHQLCYNKGITVDE